MNFQQWLYDWFYNQLDRSQRALDVCGWVEVNGEYECRRNERQCCKHTWPCEYLDYGGCAVRSLCCKLWLCGKALRNMDAICAEPDNPLRRDVLAYLQLRHRVNFLCRLLGVPLKGRCSREDAFEEATAGDASRDMNSSTERWYDGLLLRPDGLYITTEKAEEERRNG
jgi:hypothetical protein